MMSSGTGRDLDTQKRILWSSTPSSSVAGGVRVCKGSLVVSLPGLDLPPVAALGQDGDKVEFAGRPDTRLG